MVINKRENFLKYIIFGVMLMVLIFPMVNAQQNTTNNAGITPDSFLWGFDKALDQLSLILTTGDANKAEKALEIAQERLAEIKIMIEENKSNAAERAKVEHGKLLSGIEQDIIKLKEDNSTDEIKKVIDIEKKLEVYDREVEQTFGELKIKIKVEGNMTQEQKKLIASILDSLKGQTGKVEIEIRNKKDEIKVKINQETGKSEKEIESEIKDMEVEQGIEKDKKALDAINDAEEEFTKFFKKAGEKNISVSQDLINQFNSLLKEAKNQFDQGNFIEARKLAKQAERLVDNEKEGDKEFESEKEIEVETEDGKTNVNININGERLKFEMNSTDLDVIVGEISSRTGLGKDEIKSIMKTNNKGEQEKEAEKDNEKEDRSGDKKDKEESSLKNKDSNTRSSDSSTSSTSESSSSSERVSSDEGNSSK